MALTDKALYDKLVTIGVMPSVAERIIADANAANDELPTEQDVQEDAKVTEADLALAAQYWLYSPAVPKRFKRVLHATATR